MPTSNLDPRFSEPGSQPTPWSDAERALEGGELFWITTVRPDGRPHVSPLVAVWHGGALYFSTGAAEQKAVNLRANNRVVLTTGCNTWQEGLDVVVEGDAVRVTDDARLTRLAQEWARKWDGRWTYEPGDGGFQGDAEVILVFRVRPDKVFAFGKGTFSHTRHAF